MVKYSNVALRIFLKEPIGHEVTEHLGVSPTLIRESTLYSGKIGAEPKATIHHTWELHSPKDEDANAGERLAALIDVITPFSERLISLDGTYRRHISLMYHLIPEQRDGSIFGNSIGLGISAPNMSKLGAWNLVFFYEAMWFNHPDREKKNP